jgi:glycosyltransferase involved in cell wall biosynthesis
MLYGCVVTTMKISVCMPYWVRQEELNRSLAAYRSLYSHLDLEIVVCDDGSPEPVHAPGCVVVSLPRKQIGLNPCVPINRAVQASRGDVIIITNPEIEHREDVLSGMLAMLQSPKDYVTAACRDVDGSWLAGPEVDYSKDGRLPVPEGSHFHFCAMMYRKFFDELGGFDEGYRNGRACEDNDWLWNLQANGARFLHYPGTVWHYRTPHTYQGTRNSNLERLISKWGHLWP